MDGEETPTCGEGQHDWIICKDVEDVTCVNCDAEGLDCWIESDQYGEEGYILHVDTHTHQLDDALKAAREAPKAQDIVWDNLEPIEAPKITTQPRLLVEISDDENVLQQYEE